MAEFTSFPPGTPSWVDLSTADVRGACGFYGRLFDWDVSETGPGGGGYCMFVRRGRHVAGVGPMPVEGQPPLWTTYVTVDDADATTARARAAGATVAVKPMDVLDAGRMAVFVDPTGATIAVWEPRAHQGAQIANEPGALCWNELQTRDTAAAAVFYRAVFGWTTHRRDGPGAPYTEWWRGDDPVGGLTAMPAEVPPQIPAYWLAYFAVDGCEAAVARAAALGGACLAGPLEIPCGRCAVLSDPAGAVFAVIAMSGS